MPTITQMLDALLSRSPQRTSGGPGMQRPQLSSHSIDKADPAQVAYWSRYFGVTALQLCAAVEKAGRNPSLVYRLLCIR
jgi:hypothetical protein